VAVVRRGHEARVLAQRNSSSSASGKRRATERILSRSR
jgi:hypothetical protein